MFKHSIMCCNVTDLFTLSPNSRVRMYDAFDCDFKDLCDSLNVGYHEIMDINNELNVLKDINPDYIVVCGWRQIIGKVLLKEFNKKIVSFHPSLLPFGRGCAPIINTILMGIKKSGVTLFFMNDIIDGGDIIGQKSFRVLKSDYALDVYNKCINAGVFLVNKYLPFLDNVKSFKQDESGVVVFKSPVSNKIFWGDSLDVWNYKIRAFSFPYNGAYVECGNKRLIIDKCKLIKN